MGGSDSKRTDLQQRIGYAFADSALLSEALTHSSFVAENQDATSYERLEFLGDAVIELATTDIIYARLPLATEGEMTRIRASVVDEKTLASIARELELGGEVRLGRGEDQSGGRQRDSILSDVVESILGAVHLDGGWNEADIIVRRLWGPLVEEVLGSGDVQDPRSRLQEQLARQGVAVTFEYERSGPDHATVFVATAVVDGERIATADGPSKKAAAIEAARRVLEDSPSSEGHR